MYQGNDHIDTDTIAPELSGHRPIVFSNLEMVDTVLPTEEMDLLLLRDNRIVASTARSGRYAVGQLFYARSPRQYADLRQACSQAMDGAPMFLAFAHNRSILLTSGALLENTDLVVAIALHGNVKRTRRVVKHCFADVITWLDGELPPEGGLRRGDESFYRGLGGVVRLFRWLFYGCGGSIEITEREQLITLLRGRMSEILRLLPTVSLIDGEGDPTDAHYPCLGTVNIAHTVASLLCFLLGAHDCFARCALRMTADTENMYPHFTLTVTERRAGAPRLDAHPAIAEAVRLSLRHATLFECIAIGGPTDDWHICLSPMHARYDEMYTLRSEVAELQK